MTTRLGRSGSRHGFRSAAARSAAEAAPTPSTDHLLAALSLLDDAWLLAGLDGQIFQVEDNIAFLAATDRDGSPSTRSTCTQAVPTPPAPTRPGPGASATCANTNLGQPAFAHHERVHLARQSRRAGRPAADRVSGQPTVLGGLTPEDLPRSAADLKAPGQCLRAPDGKAADGAGASARRWAVASPWKSFRRLQTWLNSLSHLRSFWPKAGTDPFPERSRRGERGTSEGCLRSGSEDDQAKAKREARAAVAIFWARGHSCPLPALGQRPGGQECPRSFAMGSFVPGGSWTGMSARC